jgi:hypothetical protein
MTFLEEKWASESAARCADFERRLRPIATEPFNPRHAYNVGECAHEWNGVWDRPRCPECRAPAKFSMLDPKSDVKIIAENDA